MGSISSRQSTLVALLLSALLAACNPFYRDIEGEVFVVTKGGQNIKLPLVVVIAVDEAATPG